MGARTSFAVACALTAMLTALPAADAAPKAHTYGTRLGSHSMLYLNHTAVQQEALFRAAAEAGVRYLRMDFAVGSVFAWDRTDFSAVERIDQLAARYRVQVLGVITDTPWYIAQCPAADSDRLRNCAPAPQNEDDWRGMVAAIVSHAPRIRYWELGNEPDNGFGFAGSAADYARWATLAAQGIRAGRAGAKIVIGGFSRLDTSYIAAVLHDRSNPLITQVDVANVHLRGSAGRMGSAVRRAKAFYARMGFSGPLWVTETGYPSLRAQQYDRRLRDGESAQARWIVRGASSMIDAGAGAVFVSFRDGPEFGPQSAFASEGVLRWPELTPDGRAYPKPAFWALKALAARKLRAYARAGGGRSASRRHAHRGLSD